jgi:cytochrome c biogenesis protein CcdA
MTMAFRQAAIVFVGFFAFMLLYTRVAARFGWWRRPLTILESLAGALVVAVLVFIAAVLWD